MLLSILRTRAGVNPAAFALPADNIGRFGGSPGGTVVGPGTHLMSLSIYRSFRYKERYALRIGSSSTNLVNHPNYGVPNLGLGTAPFRTISSLQTAEDWAPRDSTGRPLDFVTPKYCKRV
jgi:hypothetical protein